MGEIGWPYTMAAVALGGFVGANLRWWVDRLLAERLGNTFPYGTLGVNVTGCLMLALLTGSLGRWVPFAHPLMLLLSTGVIGSYTTFSSFAYESIWLYGQGRYVQAAANVAANVLFCTCATAMGLWLAHTL